MGRVTGQTGYRTMDKDKVMALTGITASVVGAYLTHNKIGAAELPVLISSTYAALAKTAAPLAIEAAAPDHVPAVSIRKSLASPEFIISMIDGKPYRVLGRHLTTHGLSPDEYRARYKLPADYPIVAPAYAAKRSEMAKRIGLGRKKVEEKPVSARRKLKIAIPAA
jgi:predicted transcriptional regulator